jgi:predicted CoA-binding protein
MPSSTAKANHDPIRHSLFLSGSDDADSLDMEVPIDIVNVFRRASAFPDVVREIEQLHQLPRAVWLQQAEVDAKIEDALHAMGVQVIKNKCLLTEHIRVKNLLLEEEDAAAESVTPTPIVSVVAAR